MSEPVQIGIRELYDLMKEVDTKVDSLVSEQSTLKWRIEQLERRQDSGSVNRPVWVGVGGSYLASIAAFLSPLFTK